MHTRMCTSISLQVHTNVKMSLIEPMSERSYRNLYMYVTVGEWRRPYRPKALSVDSAIDADYLKRGQEEADIIGSCFMQHIVPLLDNLQLIASEDTVIA